MCALLMIVLFVLNLIYVHVHVCPCLSMCLKCKLLKENHFKTVYLLK